MQVAKQAGEGDRQPDQQRHRQPRPGLHGRGQDQKLAGEHAERRKAGDGNRADQQTPADGGLGADQATNLLDRLGAGDLRRVPDRDEHRALGQRVHGHVQQRGEGGERPAHAEGEGHEPHVFDRGVAEHSLDVALSMQEQTGDQKRQHAEGHHQIAGEIRVQRSIDDHFHAHQGVQRHVQQQAGENRRHRRWTFGVRVRQPVVQGDQANLGAIADQQEDEGDGQHRRFQAAGGLVQHRPGEGVVRIRDHTFGGEVQQHGAEQRLGNADAAENEIFPRRLDGLGGAVQGHQQHGGEGGAFHGHPQDADVVGGECRHHGEHEALKHGVVQTHPCPAEMTYVDLMLHVGAREDGGGEADEGGQRHQIDIEGVDVEKLAGGQQRAVVQHRPGQPQRRGQARAVDRHVDPAGAAAMPDQRQQHHAGQGQE